MASLNLALMTQTARQTFQAAGLPQGINVNDHLAYISSVCDAVQRAWSDWASQAMLKNVSVMGPIAIGGQLWDRASSP